LETDPISEKFTRRSQLFYSTFQTPRTADQGAGMAACRRIT